MKTEKIRLGEAIRVTREVLGISREELSIKAEISISSVISIETGRRDSRIATCIRISRALGVDIEKLITLTTEITPLLERIDALEIEMKEIVISFLKKERAAL